MIVVFTKIFGSLDWRHWLLSHLVWVVALTVAVIMGHSYIAEHDARVLADAQIKTSEANIVSLQQQIAATNAAAAQKVQVITKIVHDVQTPAQALVAVPQLTDVPLNARVSTDSPNQVSVDAVPFVELLGQCKTDAVNLNACQSDLKNQTTITAEKQNEIVALKKKPAFWTRVKKTAQIVAICIGIGITIGAHL